MASSSRDDSGGSMEFSEDEGKENRSPESSQVHFQAEPQASKKKKMPQPFRALKKLFGRKRTKSKDEEGVSAMGLKAKSASDISSRRPVDPESDDESGATLGEKCMSVDSVFTGQPQKDSRTHHSGAIDVMPKQALSNELYKKIRSRRGGEEDDGLPDSPVSHPTTADIIENGLKANPKKSMSRESEQSLLSMDSSENELEENFFQPKWTAAVPSQRPKTTAGITEGGIDLDAVTSTSSLNTDVQRHRIKVKQPGKRVTTHYAQKRRTQSPISPLAAGSMALPQVKEETPPKESPKSKKKKPKPEIKSPKPKDIKKSKESPKPKSSTKPDSKPTSPVSPVSPKSPTSPKSPKSPVTVEEPPKSPEPVEEKAPVVVEEAKKPTEINIKRTSDPKEEAKPADEPKVSENDKTTEESSSKTEAQVEKKDVVILRKKPEKKDATDISKRQTVADPALLKAEERKPKRSSAFVPRNWDDLDKPKEKPKKKKVPTATLR